MTFIVVSVAIVFLLFGYYAMDKIDKYLAGNVFSSNQYLSNADINNKVSKRKVILIYGDNGLTKLIRTYCDSEQYIYEGITEFNNIGTANQYSCLLALSNNDADNLMIASVGLKVYSISHIITLCNSQNNLKLYNEFNFDRVLLLNNEMDELFNIVKGFVQNAIKNEV